MNGTINKVLEKAYLTFVPSAEQLADIDNTAKNIVSYLENRIKKIGVSANVVTGGSFAKRTWIKGESDIDIFVVFDEEKDIKTLEHLVPKGFLAVHGTRRYFVGKVNDIPIDVVPVVRFTDVTKAKNSVDFSIFHADYVKKALNEQLRKDVIILKRFCKVNDCYGSETYRHGFSGYVLELLTLQYGGFLKLLDAISNWKPGQYIDYERIYESKEKAREAIGAKDNPLIIVDPTNRYRNIAGSVSLESFARLVFYAKKFLLSPSISFFEERDEESAVKALSKKRGTLLFKHVSKIREPRDVFLARYKKRLSMLKVALSHKDIGIYAIHSIYSDKDVKTIIEVSSFPKTKTRMILGPYAWLRLEDFKKFLHAHKDAYVSRDRAVYDAPYNMKNPKGFILKEIKKYLS